MTRYEKLTIKAEKLGIRVREIDFGIDDEVGYYYNNKILINSRLTEKQKHGVLAEEIGHHSKTHGDITDQTKIQNRKQELAARREGYKLVLEPLDLVYGFRCGCHNTYELADFFEITEKELCDIIDDFRKQYGMGKKFDKYYVMFEPTIGFYEIFGDNYVY